MFKRKIKLNIKKLCYQSKLKKIAYFFPSKFCIFVLYNLKKGLATRVFELELGETGGGHLCNAGVRELEGFSQVFSRSFVQSDVRLGDYR